ncbi:putative multidrug efflux system protein [Triangularia verruculosa]|uniref:Multidrug efflux system protein n=1 Tax=Triangularia verruculosa TaxID=2587418 RepID=A0AAN7AUT8_9PEZI|nr:putative multidrug efflux system protein [Triangularia verruculosa]
MSSSTSAAASLKEKTPDVLANSIGSDSDSTKVEVGLPTHTTPDEPPPRNIHGFKWISVVIAILSSIFLYALDNTVVADITPAAVNAFGNSLKLPWLSVGFLLGGVSVVLPFGKLYSLFNAKWLYISSTVLFNVGSALCGAAPSMDALIVGRVLAGMGGNGMYLGTMNLLSATTTNAERPGYLSFVGLVWGVGTVLGPVVGGAFVESPATWRWAFYINLCIAGLFAPVYLLWIPSYRPQPKETSSRELAKRFDFAGTVLSVAAIMTLVMAINLGGALYAWNSGQIIALFVVSFALFGVFGVQQSWNLGVKGKNNKIFPTHFLRRWNLVLLFCCAAAINAAAFVPIYYIPLYFQFTRGDSPTEAAVRLLPLIFTLSAAILVNGHLMVRWQYFQPWYVIGSALALVGGALLSRIEAGTPESHIYGFEILIGLGTGAFAQAGYAVIQTLLPPEEMAYGISFVMLGQQGGIAFGLAIAGAVFVNDAIANLMVALPGVPRNTLQLALSGHSGEYLQSLSEQSRIAAIEAIVLALQKVFIPVYVGGAVGLVVSVCFTKRKMSKDVIAIAA